MKFELTMTQDGKPVHNETLAMLNKDDSNFDAFFNDFLNNLPSEDARGFFKKAVDLDVNGTVEETLMFYGPRSDDFVATGRAGQMYTIIVKDRLVPVTFLSADGKPIDHIVDANHPMAGLTYVAKIVRIAD